MSTDGGPAFPTLDEGWVSEHRGQNGEHDMGFTSIGGMSLRDYFAGQALPRVEVIRTEGESLEHRCLSLARAAYLMADAMLKARETPNG